MQDVFVRTIFLDFLKWWRIRDVVDSFLNYFLYQEPAPTTLGAVLVFKCQVFFFFVFASPCGLFSISLQKNLVDMFFVTCFADHCANNFFSIIYNNVWKICFYYFFCVNRKILDDGIIYSLNCRPNCISFVVSAVWLRRNDWYCNADFAITSHEDIWTIWVWVLCLLRQWV